MNSKTSICNLALAYLGQAPISSLSQDNQMARWLSLFYEPVREEVLRTHNWAFATAEKPLVQVPSALQGGGQNNPKSFPNGSYVYKYPADALFIQGVYDPQHPHCPQPFSQRLEESQRVILTPVPQARVRYTRRVTDETQYDPAFVKCLALALASDTALALTGDVDLAARLQQKYTLFVEEARQNNMAEGLSWAPQHDAFSEVR